MPYKYNAFTEELDYYEPPPQDLDTGDSPTFAGIVIADGGTIGQAAGPLLTFDDTSDLLKLTGASFRHGTATNYYEFAVGSDGDLTITTVDSDGAEGDIVLMPDGNVGIGTTSPVYKLDVQGVKTEQDLLNRVIAQMRK